jgi:hypothetical protein
MERCVVDKTFENNFVKFITQTGRQYLCDTLGEMWWEFSLKRAKANAKITKKSQRI